MKSFRVGESNYYKSLRLFLILLTGLCAMSTSSHAEDPSVEATAQKAVFAGGCFWCTEAAFDYADGVLATTPGYTGGDMENPDYKQVSGGHTGHYEALEVTYVPAQINYEGLLKIYWESIDPTDSGGQFADRGSQYQTAIFYLNEEQRRLAEQSKKEIAERLNAEIHTKILPAGTFYPAEEYHRDYHIKNPVQYERYKHGSGRVRRLQEIWND